MSKRIRHDAVSIEIAASPDHVYELVSDISRMGEWSPECVRCTWKGDASGPVVGARFKARNKGRRGPPWFNTPRVITADAGREFAFTRSGPGIGSYTWRYVMEPMATGTRLTESFDAERPLGAVMSWLTEQWTGSSDRDADLHQGMTTTLAHIKTAAEQA
ncbi:MAG: SRPBCC family protein [Mycobacteriaceae bacterium]